MLRIRQSNRLDRLADDLVAELAQAKGRHPLQADLVVVQSPGMATWLRHRLALHSGIAAGVEFPLPASLIWRLVRALVPEATEQSLYDKSDMSWRLFTLLAPGGELLRSSTFATLADYLTDDDSGLKRHQLAQRIADVFDQYLVYRPDWMESWRLRTDDAVSAARSEPWQPVLWRALVAATGNAPDRAELQNRAITRLATDASAGDALRAELPERIDVFGLSAMPPEQMRLLLALAGHVDLVMHVFNPCRGYWADIVSERYLAHLVADETARDAAAPTHPYYDTGHPLLGSLGRAGRDFVDLLVELGEDAAANVEPREAFEAPTGTDALALLQADILDLRGPDEECSALAADDESIVFADCHGPLREVEALHDWLLARFEADPELRPRDVVVMIPDVDSYAPCIETVFGAGASASASAIASASAGDTVAVRIPFGISDRGLRGEAPVLAAVTTLLGLPRDRLTLSQVLGLLQTPAVMRAAGLDEAGLEQIAFWLEEAGVRWGRDATHWQALGFPVPETDAARMPNSWAFGLDRMLLGYAAGDGEPFRDLLPLAGVEGGATEAVGALLGFLARLDALAQALSGEHDAAAWSRILAQMLEDLVAAGDDEADALEGLRRAIAALGELPARCALTSPLSLDVVTSALEPALQAPGGGHRFLAGQVTFCTLMPMRTIPFRIVALLGMNDQDYPRREVPLGFDLLARFPRKGDRARRLEDRYLFLEAILAAREHLYLGWSGRSPVDDTVRPPSVVVAELRDVLDRRFQAADGGSALTQLTRRHALQPFSGRYHLQSDEQTSEQTGEQTGALYTFASTWTRRATADTGVEPVLPPPVADEVLGLAALTRFLLDPAGAFLLERFDVRLGVEGGGVEDDEPFLLGGLERHRVRAEALDAARAGVDEAAWMQRERVTGRLPHGGPGQDALARARFGVAAYRERLGPWLQAPTDNLAVDLEIAGVRLQGDVPDCLQAARLTLRAGQARERDHMRLWVAHLALCAAGLGRPSVLVDQQGGIHAPVLSEAAARTLLGELIEVRRQVLAGPAPLLCATSAAFGLSLSAGADKAMVSARKAWVGSDFGPPGEARAAAVARLWPGFPGDDADLARAFADLAERVWTPVTALEVVADNALVPLLFTGALPDE